MRTYLYKLTYDEGTAPCAPPEIVPDDSFLTLAICKPAIRRTAKEGDRVVGIASNEIRDREGYRALEVIYAMNVTKKIEGHDYYEENGKYWGRPDCIYRSNPEDGTFTHLGETDLHSDPDSKAKDVGRGNAVVLRGDDFRYFGRETVAIPSHLVSIWDECEQLTQGHRVFEEDSKISGEFDALFKLLWRKNTRYTATGKKVQAPCVSSISDLSKNRRKCVC